MHKLLVVALCLHAVANAAVELPNSLELVNHVNSQKTTWKAAVNPRFEGVSIDVIRGMMGVKGMDEPLGLPIVDRPSVGDLPENFDARVQWANCQSVKEIRDQGSCGSCWAFGAIEAMNDRICIHSSGASQVHLSVEDLVNCCKTCGMGCNGGYPAMAWRYWVNKGIVTDGCMPYDLGKSKAINAACQCVAGYPISYANDKHFGVSSYGVQGVDKIRQEIFTNGPVEAAFTVYEDFMYYATGVYQHMTGKMLGGHAVKIIGWGVENGTPYWTVANSWGPVWGEQGYFKIKRGNNECGIEGKICAGMPKL